MGMVSRKVRYLQASNQLFITKSIAAARARQLIHSHRPDPRFQNFRQRQSRRQPLNRSCWRRPKLAASGNQRGRLRCFGASHWCRRLNFLGFCPRPLTTYRAGRAGTSRRTSGSAEGAVVLFKSCPRHCHPASGGGGCGRHRERSCCTSCPRFCCFANGFDSYLLIRYFSLNCLLYSLD